MSDVPREPDVPPKPDVRREPDVPPELDVPREPDAPGAFGQPKISIPAGERAQMTPAGIEPMDLPRRAYEAGV